MAPVKRALVTGGAGFIGSHLCDFLIERGWEVTALDDFSSGAAQNLAHLEGEATFRLVRGDFSDGALMDRWVPWASAVFHLAGMASAPQSLQDPQQCFQRNVEAFKDLLLRLRDHPVPLVYASSAAVYGENAGPCREDQIPRP